MELNLKSDTFSNDFRKYYKPLEPFITKPQNRVYTATILSFLVISLFLWYAVRPTMQTIFSLRREIKDNEQTSLLMEEKISALVQAQATYQSITNDIPLLTQGLPRDPQVLPALITIRNLANSVDATISAVQIPQTDLEGEHASQSSEANVLPGEPQPVELSLSVDGTYQSIKSFIDGLITMRRIIAVQEIHITPLATSDEVTFTEPEIRAIFKLHTFFLPGGRQ